MGNAAADALENVAAMMSLLRDNITNLHVLYDDQQILHFVANVDVFKHAAIDEDDHE